MSFEKKKNEASAATNRRNLTKNLCLSSMAQAIGRRFPSFISIRANDMQFSVLLSFFFYV